MSGTTVILAVIGLLAAGQGILLALVLLAKKTNPVANRLLGTLMGIFSLAVLYAVYIITGLFRNVPQFIGITYPFPFVYGPLWYLYTRSLTYGHSRLGWSDLLHFVPALLAFGILVPYLLQSAEWKISLMENFSQRVPLLLLVGSLCMTAQGIVYFVLAVSLIRRNLKRILDLFSAIENISLRWLRNITVAIGIIWLIVAIVQILRLSGMPLFESMSPIVAGVSSIFVFTAGYLGLRQPEVFEAPAFVNAEERTIGRYSKSGLSDERKQQILGRLKEHLETAKPYLNNSLTLKDLADALSVSEHNLSEVINTSLGQSFFYMVNSCRVQEVQRRLNDPAHSHFTLTAIAFDSGFNSKSTFNAVFRKITGITPSEYRRTVQDGPTPGRP